MSVANRPAPDTQAFVDMIDGFCVDIGILAYSEIARALPHHVAAHEMAERHAADLYAALRIVTEHAAAAEVNLMFEGEAMIAEAQERAAAARSIGGRALNVAEMRVDLDGRDDVTVLADARTRLRAAGRRL